MTKTPKKTKKKPDELTSDEVIQKLFPKKVVKEIKKLSKRRRKKPNVFLSL